MSSRPTEAKEAASAGRIEPDRGPVAKAGPAPAAGRRSAASALRAGEAPIFLLGIQRGGTNQILNILRSHPRTFWPEGEFHEVFRGRGLHALRREGLARTLRKWRHYLPILLTAGDILDPDRRPAGPGLLGRARGRWIAEGLRRSAWANRASVAAFKKRLADRGHIDASRDPDRLVVKVMNYNLGFAEDLAALYPDATFVGFVRDGRAVCEGHVMRGADPVAAAAVYDFVARRLIALETAGLRIRTWRFEDAIVDPARIARQIYTFCGLDPGAARGVCLQDKERVLDAGGRLRGVRKVERFYSLGEMAGHMRTGSNAAALARLPAAARREIEERCRPVLTHFGYLERAGGDGPWPGGG